MFKGYKICPPWLKIKYRQAVNFTCQDCNKHEEKVGTLSPHRLKRANKGGLYSVVKLNHKENNVKIVCSSCHKKYHYNENKNIKSN